MTHCAIRIRQGKLVCSGSGRAQANLPLSTALVFVHLVALGCSTANYTAANLPAELRAPPSPESTGINLERMVGAGVGTSYIGAGDLIEITIVSGSGDERVTPVPARVAEDGTAMVPLIGSVPVGGIEPVAAEQRIAAAAIERGIYRQPYITVVVKDPAVNRITVLGAVAKPGVVELPRGSSDLASAIAAAGGLSKEASNRVEVLHRDSKSFLAENSNSDHATDSNSIVQAKFDANESIQGKPDVSRIDLAMASTASVSNRKLDDRDVVMVMPEEKRVIHVTGLVKTPDQYELPRDKDLRVLDAIAMAGGSTSLVADKVYVIRQLGGDRQPAVIKVSMSKAKRDGNQNLRLTAGDLVSVESTAATMTLDTVGKFFRIALGLNSSVTGF